MGACFGVARATLWSQTPVDVEVMQELAGQFFKIAVEHEESFVSDKQDPNIIVVAVHYLGGVHAIPPMRDDTHWFFDMLAVLVELVLGNAPPGEEMDPLYRAIEASVAGHQVEWAAWRVEQARRARYESGEDA
jgi:hypothetical protein